MGEARIMLKSDELTSATNVGVCGVCVCVCVVRAYTYLCLL